MTLDKEYIFFHYKSVNQTVQGLDPKLQETYNRVMGTEIPKVNNSPAAQPSQRTTQQPSPPSSQAPHVTATPSPTAQSPTTAYVSSKKGGLPWWIFLVLGIVFFALYTFFWINTFNLSLSF